MRKKNASRYKCSIDASFSIILNKVDNGICMKDDQWHFVLTKTEWFLPIIFEMDIGEAIGIF